MTQRQRVRTSHLRDEAEDILIHNVEHSSDLSGKTPDEIIHDLRGHQIELEIQIKELKISVPGA
ncbi:MAG TPA: hypothetical protein VN372_07710 [Methanospirillum sp.]|nr:hypothetical protein [Methanospirillum sp.]